MGATSKDRFWKRVDQTPGHGPEGKCWLWTGSRTRDGYGRYCKNATSVPAARESWERKNGKLFPKGKLACHSCDNPPCVNPEHIFPGSALENTADAIAKGRFKAVLKPAARPHCKRGHDYDEGNTRWRGSRRVCRACEALRTTKKRRRKDGIQYRNVDMIAHKAEHLEYALRNIQDENVKAALAALMEEISRQKPTSRRKAT